MVNQFSVEIFEKKTCPECGKVIQPTEKLMEHMVSIHELKTPHSIKKGKFFPWSE